MVRFIKVTIIQWYIVLNSQKYEQVFTARHAHNGNTSLQKQLHTDDRESIRRQPENLLVLFFVGGGGGGEKTKKKKSESPGPLKAEIYSVITKAFKEKWAHTSGLLQTIPGGEPGVWGTRAASTPHPSSVSQG